ncbi:hypothetical protein J1770_gp15 [Gordonia phage EMoore]|uniref:Uncharacterized protein n=1 Tax=Gordonia phage EMoore TaxID=2656534 RepID=A0A649VU65_9CAUD|nr:hypothetical protein J1770_gp15 [Gordonia phage EMoore]QGJ95801.1 hypothetical protein SEA_EMOORE_15 [Gordonia phage EMoore]
MGCNCRRQKVVVFEVEFADGTIKRVLTEEEVRKLRKNAPDSIWRKVTR